MKSAKLIAFYFSAHWCPPCRTFTPTLASFYNEVNSKEKQIEIVFVSLDRDEKQFNEYFAEMPWVTLPFQDSRIETFSDQYECQGIPYLVVIKQDGTLVSKTGRNDVQSSGAAAIQKWLK